MMLTVCFYRLYSFSFDSLVLKANGYEKLTTALYFKGDPYLYSDAVFGVKSSLIVVRIHSDFSVWIRL